MSLKGRDLLTLGELAPDEVQLILDRAAEMRRSSRTHAQVLAGRVVALLFSKPSTRTRVSFEAGIRQLGGAAIFLSHSELQLGRGETVSDTGRVLGLYTDALVVRTFAQSEVEELAVAAAVPVINALTDDYHPCQVLADLLTIQERCGRLEGVRLAYLGDGNNVAATLLIGSALMGIEFRIATPEGYRLSEELVGQARSRWGADPLLTDDPAEAVRGADIVYTDTWTSMGHEEEGRRRLAALAPYQLNAELLAEADGAAVMHCLPAHRGEEITAEVMDGPQSIIWEQAENRLHAQKALLSLVLANE